MKSPNKHTRRDLISRRKQVSHIDLIKINGQQVAQAPMFPIHRTRSTGNYFISSWIPSSAEERWAARVVQQSLTFAYRSCKEIKR